MKIKEISIEMTRQVRQFEPLKLTVTAQLSENENSAKCVDELRAHVITLLYKDDETQQKMLIDKLNKINN